MNANGLEGWGGADALAAMLKTARFSKALMHRHEEKPRPAVAAAKQAGLMQFVEIRF